MGFCFYGVFLIVIGGREKKVGRGGGGGKMVR